MAAMPVKPKRDISNEEVWAEQIRQYEEDRNIQASIKERQAEERRKGKRSIESINFPWFSTRTSSASTDVGKE